MKPHVTLSVATAILLASLAAIDAAAAPLTFAPRTGDSLTQENVVADVAYRRGGAVRRRTVVGPRGGVYHSRTAVRGAAVVRPGWRGGGTRWVRPGNYWWPVGGAVAAGAAIGFVGAATAAAWAGAPPAPGYCWYYTDASKTQGFWDACPR
jgi:hypothetical protein